MSLSESVFPVATVRCLSCGGSATKLCDCAQRRAAAERILAVSFGRHLQGRSAGLTEAERAAKELYRMLEEGGLVP